MSRLDAITVRLFGPKPTLPAPKLPEAPAPARDLPANRALAGGRLSLDKADSPFALGSLVIGPPLDAESQWRVLDLDADTLSRVTPARLLELLADLSPDVSRALWDFLRLCNPGWEAKVTRPGSEEEFTEAQALVDAFLANLPGPYTLDNIIPVDVIFGALFMGAFLRGAFVAELVLDRRGRIPLNIATPDPHSIRFKKQDDPVMGPQWVMGQFIGGEFVAFDRPTIRYVPIDPFPGSPYGRPMAAPALFSTLFLLGLLHDLRRVISQQGYPRIDISINMERLRDTMPPEAANDPEAFQRWMNDLVAEVQRVYAQLEPDDAYIHSDVVTVNRSVGTVDAQSLGAVGDIITALERMAIRALKTMPLLMGVNEAASETHANRQWEVYAAGIKSLQHYAETMLSALLELALQAQGVIAKVEFRFAELRAAEELRDQQTLQMKIANYAALRDQGWITQDEAALEVVGHEAVEEQSLGQKMAEAAIDAQGKQADAEDGAERFRRWGVLQRVATLAGVSPWRLLSPPPEDARGAAQDSLENFALWLAAVEYMREVDTRNGTGTVKPKGADLPMLDLPAEVEITEGDRSRAIGLWDRAMDDSDDDYSGLLNAQEEEEESENGG